MQCSEFDALLSQAIDGTLSGERLTAFEGHAAQCKNCGPLLQEAEAGRSWIKSLAIVEPSSDLVNNILLRTSGVVSSRGRSQESSWFERLREMAGVAFSPIVAAARQPRFAMSFGMAFFTLSITLSLAGVKPGDLRHLDLRPSAIRRTYYETSGRVVKYYENIRFVYELESRVRQFKQATTPPERRHEQEDNNRKDNKDKRSGQPERQERNYSREGNQLVFASLSENRGARRARVVRAEMVDDPPVVNGATNRRFV